MSPAGYGPNDHLCWVHESESAWVDTAVSYLDEGARGQDQLLYVADKREPELVDDLRDLSGRDAMLESGQLRVVPLGEVYGATDSFDEARQVHTYHELAQAARQAGYRGLRLAAEASSMARTSEAAQRFTRYELMVDAAIAESPLSAMCGYSRHLLDDDAVRTLSFVHPIRHDAKRPVKGSLHAGGDGHWRLDGEIDVATWEALGIGLSALADGADVHLDLEDLTFIDVGGVRALARVARALAPEGRLILHEPPDTLRRMLELAWPDAPGIEVAEGEGP